MFSSKLVHICPVPIHVYTLVHVNRHIQTLAYVIATLLWFLMCQQLLCMLSVHVHIYLVLKFNLAIVLKFSNFGQLKCWRVPPLWDCLGSNTGSWSKPETESPSLIAFICICLVKFCLLSVHVHILSWLIIYKTITAYETRLLFNRWNSEYLRFTCMIMVVTSV